ncbi:MAG: TonB-dependent receptor plug domain-containing protein, partial [Bacteroidota bacterium]
INNIKLFEQNLVFGNKQYFGSQESFYSNIIYQDIIGDTRKKYKTGASFISDYYNQNYNDSIFRRQDLIPGIFGEFEFDNIEKVSFSLGARADYYNKFGMFYTPKFNFRYSISSKDVVRLTFGKGTRIANVFMDNTGIFANQRQVKVLEDLRPESGYTYGLSYAKNFRISNVKFDYYFDLFRTQFVNQVVLDYFEKYNRVYVYNLKGSSYSNTFQTEIQSNISKNFEARFGYKYYDIKTDYLSGKFEKPMISKNRFLLNLAYKTRFEKWKLDFTTRYLGKARMPVGENHLHSLYHYENFSQGFFVLNAQVTKKFKFFDVYLGGENLLNYIQSDAIVSNEKPFSDIFDATMVWGPITGRVIYAGFRHSIK